MEPTEEQIELNNKVVEYLCAVNNSVATIRSALASIEHIRSRKLARVIEAREIAKEIKNLLSILSSQIASMDTGELLIDEQLIKNHAHNRKRE